MELQRIGDWNKVFRLCSHLRQHMLEAQKQSLMRFGAKAEALAVSHLSKQDLGWRRLNPRYLRKKVKQGYSKDILIRTSTYFQSITSWVHGDSVLIGIKRDIVDENGKTLYSIAAIHEYGSRDRRIPKRPLWKPTLEEAITWHVQNNTPNKILIQILAKNYSV